eukprot:jgi/Bigna1/67255/fgenesh1_pg.3_\
MEAPAAPNKPAPMLASRYSAASLGGKLIREAIRIRHLKQILMRNLQGKDIVGPVDCYYTLLEESELEHDRKLHPKAGNSNMDDFKSLYASEQDTRLAFTPRKELSPPRFRVFSGKSGPNTVYLVLIDGVYGFPNDLTAPANRKPMRKRGPLKITVSALLQQHAQLSSPYINSFLFASVAQLSTLKRCSVEQYLARLKLRGSLENQCNEILKGADAKIYRARQVQASLTALKKVHMEKKEEKEELSAQLELISTHRKELKPRAELVLKMCKEMRRKREALEKVAAMSTALQKKRLTAETRVYLRQLRMLSILYAVYPVIKRGAGARAHAATTTLAASSSHTASSNASDFKSTTSAASSNNGNYSSTYRKPPFYTIRGVTLPDLPKDSMAKEISVALGYCAHLILLAAKYLGVILRYKIVHLGSKSYVVDGVHDPPQQVPLHFKESAATSRGVIQKGVAMLIIDTRQLLSACSGKEENLGVGTFPNFMHYVQIIDGPIRFDFTYRRLRSPYNPSQIKQPEETYGAGTFLLHQLYVLQSQIVTQSK